MDIVSLVCQDFMQKSIIGITEFKSVDVAKSIFGDKIWNKLDIDLQKNYNDKIAKVLNKGKQKILREYLTKNKGLYTFVLNNHHKTHQKFQRLCNELRGEFRQETLDESFSKI